jgi:hypothetical protein
MLDLSDINYRTTLSFESGKVGLVYRLVVTVRDFLGDGWSNGSSGGCGLLVVDVEFVSFYCFPASFYNYCSRYTAIYD